VGQYKRACGERIIRACGEDSTGQLVEPAEGKTVTMRASGSVWVVLFGWRIIFGIYDVTISTGLTWIRVGGWVNTSEYATSDSSDPCGKTLLDSLSNQQR